MTTFWIVFVIVVIISSITMTIAGYHIANEKGYDPVMYAVLSFFFSFPMCFVLIALPDLKTRELLQRLVKDEKKEHSAPEEKIADNVIVDEDTNNEMLNRIIENANNQNK